MHVRKRNLMNTWERRYIKVKYDYEIETTAGIRSGAGRCSLDFLEEELGEFLPSDVVQEVWTGFKKHVKASHGQPFQYTRRTASSRYTVNIG